MNDKQPYFYRIENHAIFYYFAFGFIFSLYLFIHFFLKEDYAKVADDSFGAASQLYRVGVDSDQFTYTLLYKGEPVENVGEIVGDLGIGKLITTQGLLSALKLDLATTNQLIYSTINDYKSAMTLENEASSTYELNLSGLGTESFGENYIVHLSLGRNRSVVDLNNDLRGLSELRLILSQAVCFYLADIPLNSTLGRSEISTGPLTRMPSFDEENCGEVLVADFDRKISEAHQFLKIQGKVPKCNVPLKADGPLRKSWGCQLSEINDALEEKLGEFAKQELSIFWVFGYFKWIDVLLVTMFGVLVEGATYLGLSIANRHPDQGTIWEPQETRRTILKLVYAPIISLFAIWTLLSTDILQIEIGGLNSAAAMITIAFLFGLFPNLPYTLFKRLAEAVFKETSIARKPDTGIVEHTVIQSGEVRYGEIPDFRKLRQKVGEHVAAPLRQSR